MTKSSHSRPLLLMRPPVPTSPPALQAAQILFPSVCSRCHLRLRNVRTTPSYALSHPSDKPCALCFDILHDATLQNVSAQLQTRLAQIHHDNRFKINTTLPVSASIIRDRAARLALPNPAPYHVSLREAFKWALCPVLQDQYGIRYCPEAPLFIDVIFRHPETDAEASFVVTEQPRKRMKLEAPSTTAVTKAVDAMSDEVFMRTGGDRFVPPPPVETVADTAVSVSVAPILFAGSYTKLSRSISQTPWFVDPPNGLLAALDADRDAHGRSKRTALSVEDVVVSGINELLQPEKATFTAGGREDVDVRMLGSGRPFVVEVVNSKIVETNVSADMVHRMSMIAKGKSESVHVHDLRVVSKSYFSKMKAFESEKRKRYRCVVWTSKEVATDVLKEKLEVEGGFILKQKTPLRVLHRRTQAVREKVIFEAKVFRVVAQGVFVLDLVASAGTYIKEFVHGDNGRTDPNVAAILGCEADILQLDVVNIHR